MQSAQVGHVLFAVAVSFDQRWSLAVLSRSQGTALLKVVTYYELEPFNDL